MCCFYLRYIVLALRVSQGVSLSLFPPPVDQLVSNLRRRILVRRSDLQWPAQTESPSLGVCDSSLHGPTCSFFGSSYVDVGLGELLPQSLLESSDDPDELRSSVNRLLRHLNHTETVFRNAEAVHFVLSLQTSTFTHMPGEVGIHYSDKWSTVKGTRPVLAPSDAAGLITFTKNVTITELVLESSSPVVVQGLSVGRVLWEGHARLSPLQSRIDMIAQSLLVGMTRSQLDVPADATANDEIRIISVSPVTLFTIEGRISINNPWASGHRSLVLEPKSRSKYRRAWLGIIADSADFVDINYIADHGLRWKRAPSAREVDLTRGVYTNDLYSEIVTMARPTPGFFKLSQHVGRVVMSIWGKTYASNEDSIIEAALATTTQDTAIVEYLRWAALSGSNRFVVDDSELDSEELAVRKDMEEVLDMMHNRFHQKAIKKPK